MKTILVFLLATMFTSSAFAAVDPFVGTWTLNLRKSKYPTGAIPKRMVIQMEPAGDGIRYRSETIDVNDRSSKAEYVANYDGREVVVRGAVGLLLPVSLKRVDPNTVEALYSRGLQVVATSRRVVSRDGRTMTVTTTSKDKDGNTVTNVGVYERTTASGK